MSAVSLSSKGQIPTEASLDDGYRKEGDESSGNVPGCGDGDPAVLAMGPARRPLCYTKEELLRLRDSPLVKRNLENAFVGCEALMSSGVCKKRSDSPNEEDRGAKGDAPNENQKQGAYPRERRSADPRERVRKESEPSGIVLSPQRRSFTSGCGAPAAAPAPPTINPTTEQGGRRIGSGRIMVRDVPAPGWEEPEFRPEPYQPHARTNGDRFERRSFNRDSFSSDMKRERDDRFNNEKTREREDNRRSGGRYSQRRYDKDVEPEWFSGGPTSQLETIELRGFDEPVKKNGAVSNKESNEKWSNKSGSGSKSPERWREKSNPTPPAPAAPNDEPIDNHEKENNHAEPKKEEPTQNNEHGDFNLDEFLKFDSIPDVLTNGGNESEGSRFSRWFRRESPNGDSKHYDQLLRNIVDDLESPTEPAGSGFVPISPPNQPAPPPQHPSLLDLLRRANANTHSLQEGAGSKIHSLEELEARLRPPAQPRPDSDLTAFKRLLAQVSGGHAVPAERAHAPQPAPQPMSLLQMLNKSMEQQQQHKVQQQQQQQQQPPHIPQELLLKLLHVQQTQRQPSGDMGAPMAAAPERELLQRPEAQAILHGLKAGEITVQHLIQQLGNPGLQSRHREVLLTILQRQQMCGSPMAAPAHLSVPQHQPLRLSPLPHPGLPARIPSPRELAAHTQSIMQSALIKKKLEEQRENYRRRHEMQPKQSTPISFTPTSVLRKMTAEKESDAPSPKPQQQPWLQPHKMPQGRPIVKGNQGGGVPMGYAPSQAEYQQHFINQQQQQMSANARPFTHPQQRQQPNPNPYNNVAMSRGMAGGTTLHQLLVHSHQRTLNEMAGASSGGGDNQLARWFSPELLARASAGKLPSVHVPNALSLEDLERHHHSPAPAVRN